MQEITLSIEKINRLGLHNFDMSDETKIKHLRQILDFPSATDEEKMNLVMQYMDESGETDILTSLYELETDIIITKALCRYPFREHIDKEMFIKAVMDMPIQKIAKTTILISALVDEVPKEELISLLADGRNHYIEVNDVNV